MERKSKRIYFYIEEYRLEKIEELIDKMEYQGTPKFNSVSHFCRCGVLRFLKNKGEF